MITPPSLPSLAGLTWSRHKKPSFNTRIATHVSGREVRVPSMTYPLYEFEANYEGLASNATAAFSGLGASSLQNLMGFFLQLQGQYGVFLYADPDDNTVVGQGLGSGDGATTSFTFVRALGGFAEPVGWVTAIANVYLNGAAQPRTAYSLTAPNTLVFTIYAALRPGALDELALAVYLFGAAGVGVRCPITPNRSSTPVRRGTSSPTSPAATATTFPASAATRSATFSLSPGAASRRRRRAGSRPTWTRASPTSRASGSTRAVYRRRASTCRRWKTTSSK